MSNSEKAVSNVNDEQKRPLLSRIVTAKLTRKIADAAFFGAFVVAILCVLVYVVAPAMRHYVIGEPPKLIEWSEFKSAEQLNDFMSRRSGTRVLQGTDWWSVEVTRPVGGFGEDLVPCARVLRTLVDGKTTVIPGDWRYNSDGFRVCRYPGDGR
ncbi:Uncharacterised protein [Mycobacteroides abscessus subsp. abscessus]|nr:Uncharacterised protein [Mycobacteroides abscessus subsp. abscessus]SLC77132.1 Uncharacterised protein [Mycobacteroides abscessus subsp. abscessus]